MILKLSINNYNKNSHHELRICIPKIKITLPDSDRTEKNNTTNFYNFFLRLSSTETEASNKN